MATQLTSEDFKQSLNAHVEMKGAELYAKFGPDIGWKELLRILDDRAFCRYPCEIVFDASDLAPGELANPVQKGDRPEDGFTMRVSPVLMTDLQQVVWVVLYQLVVVNYGDFATAGDAEAFGAGALGISKDQYYQTLCGIAAQLEECEVI